MALGISAIRRRDIQRVVPIDMTLAALHSGVLVRQWKTGGAVIELSVSPFRDWMAGSAGSRC